MKCQQWRIIAVMLMLSVSVCAIDYPTPTSWVNDYAGVLNTAQKQELDSLLKDFEQSTTNQVFVCIMPNLPAGTTLEEYVNELFAHWQPGQQDKDNGVLLAVFINDRKLRIEVGYGLEAKLTDAASRLIIANDISPSFKEGKYYQGIKNGLDHIILTIKGEYKPRPPAYKPTIFQRIQYFLYDGIDRILTSLGYLLLGVFWLGASVIPLLGFAVVGGMIMRWLLRPLANPAHPAIRRIHRFIDIRIVPSSYGLQTASWAIVMTIVFTIIIQVSMVCRNIGRLTIAEMLSLSLFAFPFIYGFSHIIIYGFSQNVKAGRPWWQGPSMGSSYRSDSDSSWSSDSSSDRDSSSDSSSSDFSGGGGGSSGGGGASGSW